ncbi:MAG: hypothetical protein UMU75_01350 [Halomonas sp.]|nr:hypothetical protein [Halomonas sp.]
MIRLRAMLLAASLFGFVPSNIAWADIAVIVGKGSDVKQLSRSEVINIFMGRYRKLPNGLTALPVDLSPSKARFYRALVNQDLAEINSYWARLFFSGQTSPPQQAASLAEVQDIIEHNQGAVTYVDKGHVTENMRIVLELDE